MHIRLATTRDLHRLAQITVTSLVDDPTFDYMWPKRHEYPEDNFFFWQLQLKKWLYDPHQTFLVMVLDAKDLIEKANVVPSTIVSYAIWERVGRSTAAKDRWAQKDTWQNLLDRSTARVEAWLISLKYERRDADKKRLAAIAKASDMDREDCFADIEDWWNMELLVTDRPFRRRGAATSLVKWGTAEADDEGVCCGVEASDMGARVYEACGFKTMKESVVQVEGQNESLQYVVMRRDVSIAAGYHILE